MIDRRPGILTLAGALAFTGLGGIAAPAGAGEQPKQIVETDKITPFPPSVEESVSNSKVIIEFPKEPSVFNQEIYVPNEEQAQTIDAIVSSLLETSGNPGFYQEMLDRYFSDFESYFGILIGPNEFGFQYSPYGFDNPVIIDFYETDSLVTDEDGKEYLFVTNEMSLRVGSDGTLFTPASETDSFATDEIPEIIENNYQTAEGLEDLDWQKDSADPLGEVVYKDFSADNGSYFIAGDTQGNLYLSTESLLPNE